MMLIFHIYHLIFQYLTSTRLWLELISHRHFGVILCHQANHSPFYCHLTFHYMRTESLIRVAVVHHHQSHHHQSFLLDVSLPSWWPDLLPHVIGEPSSSFLIAQPSTACSTSARENVHVNSHSPLPLPIPSQSLPFTSALVDLSIMELEPSAIMHHDTTMSKVTLSVSQTPSPMLSVCLLEISSLVILDAQTMELLREAEVALLDRLRAPLSPTMDVTTTLHQEQLESQSHIDGGHPAGALLIKPPTSSISPFPHTFILPLAEPHSPGTPTLAEPHSPGTPTLAEPHSPGTPTLDEPHSPGTPTLDEAHSPGTPTLDEPHSPGTPTLDEPHSPGTPTLDEPHSPGTPTLDEPHSPGTPTLDEPHSPGTPTLDEPHSPGTPTLDEPHYPGTPTLDEPHSPGTPTLDEPHYPGTPTLDEPHYPGTPTLDEPHYPGTPTLDEPHYPALSILVDPFPTGIQVLDEHLSQGVSPG